MPGLYKDEGVVLTTIKLGEADRILTVFTRFNGKVRAVAKGVRKTKSRFGGRLEPFTRVQLLIYRGRNLDTVTSADILSSFDEIRSDYTRIIHAAALVEIVDKITPERERSVRVYTLLLAGLEAIARGANVSVVPAFVLKLLSISGYHPQLTVCAGCGNGGRLAAFSPALGGAVCDPCRTDDHGAVELTGDRLALLSHLLVSDFGAPADPIAAADVTTALRGYAEYHLERPLRSLRFLATSH
ncbi:MAG TPA: DNA repair protein RecO [Actinomycetota bacterium]|jgi:DNA repair protein RecO (recombination protein O)|nr:DNA repair protein RecO [Actinomycetota bacterium]